MIKYCGCCGEVLNKDFHQIGLCANCLDGIEYEREDYDDLLDKRAEYVFDDSFEE